MLVSPARHAGTSPKSGWDRRDPIVKTLGWLFVGIVAVAVAVACGIRDSYDRAVVDAGRRSGRLPTRWTDVNRWKR